MNPYPAEETHAKDAKHAKKELMKDKALTIWVAHFPSISFCLGVLCALCVKSICFFQYDPRYL